ncbi:hypothetical protein ABZZ79_32090 [Streptomyces sp. NPDC006458]|uniref:hypothetical protein n=1 Tax=Streptomyces sp. NPDC006458 TaxID=3154302 RepID=UPI0033B16B55
MWRGCRRPRRRTARCDQPAQRRRTVTDALADLIRVQADELGVTPAMPAETAALTLLSLGIGLGVQRAFGTTVPVQPVVDLLRSVMSGRP